MRPALSTRNVWPRTEKPPPAPVARHGDDHGEHRECRAAQARERRRCHTRAGETPGIRDHSRHCLPGDERDGEDRHPEDARHEALREHEEATGRTAEQHHGDAFIDYMVDTEGGQSGSPVWFYDKRRAQRFVIAIHTTGDFVNRGLLIKGEIFDTIRAWRAG